MFDRFSRKIKSWLNSDDMKSHDDSIMQSYGLPLAGTNALFGLYQNGSYDNNYPNITRIAESFAEVLPFAIDEKGKRLKKDPNLIEVLYNPNEEMSITDFLETLMVMLLVHPVVYILCWHREGNENVPGGPIREQTLAGLTFLEGVSASYVGNEVTYYAGTETWTKDDVIALSLNINPYNLLAGYSPSIATKKWACVDDYVADYQAGYFANNAIPAGELIITTPTVEEYEATVKALKKHHKGAGKNNNLMYVHRPTSNIDGRPLNSQIEWVPFSQATKDSALQSIFDQSNKKIDMTFGVPEEVKGHLSNSNYASAEVADYVFSRRVVYPKLKKIYSKLTHEFNRITGGLGYALDFDYEEPVLTDTRKQQTESLITLLNAGFTVESSVEALRLPMSFLSLKEKPKEEPVANNSEDAANDSEVIDEDSQEISQSESKDDSGKKKGKCCDHSVRKDIVDEMLTEEPDEEVDPEILTILMGLIIGLIDQVISEIKEPNDDNLISGLILGTNTTDTQPSSGSDLFETVFTANAIKRYAKDFKHDEKTARLFNAALLYIMSKKGQDSAKEFAEELGISEYNSEIPLATLEATEKAAKEYTDSLISQIAEKIEKETKKAVDNGLTTAETIIMLEALKKSEAWRAKRTAVTEQHLAEETGILESAKEAGRIAKKEVYKTWHIRDGACIYCVPLAGETVPIDQVFSNGEKFPRVHPNCRCYLTYEFRDVQKSIKLTCPHCKRYLLESASNATLKNVICGNSKCKHRYNIEISDSNASFTDIRKDSNE